MLREVEGITGPSATDALILNPDFTIPTASCPAVKSPIVSAPSFAVTNLKTPLPN
jgi:hypothetical protein